MYVLIKEPQKIMRHILMTLKHCDGTYVIKQRHKSASQSF